MDDAKLASLGKYEIRGTLGRGAMGVVYEGWDPAIARKVAIKTVRVPDAGDTQASDELARFRREAQAAGRLNHPNIVGVFDYGETAELAYIVMEFVDGRTLKSVLDGQERFALPEMLRVMEDVLAGLQYSHEHGVVHRDIKPANIILANAGCAKIADFGIARIESSSMTQAGTVLGTPAYMSPEQFMGQVVSARTDIYSTGVVLYQLLTGERPFDGSLTAIMHKVLNTHPPKPSDLSVTASPALDAVVERAMARRPEDRFANAAEFGQALRQAAEAGAAAPATAVAEPDGEATIVAVPQRPPSPPPAAREPPPPARSSRLPVTIAAGVVLLAIVGGGAWLALSPRPAPAPQVAQNPAQVATVPETPAPAAASPATGAPSAPATTPPPTATAAVPAASVPLVAAQASAPPAAEVPSPTAASPAAVPAQPAPVPSKAAQPEPSPVSVAPASAPPPAQPAQAGPPPTGSVPAAAPQALTPPTSTPPASTPPASTSLTSTPPPAATPAPPTAPSAPAVSAPPRQVAMAINPASLRNAIAAATAGVRCALVAGDVAEPGGGIVLDGLAGQGAPEARLHEAVADAAHGAPVDWRLASFNNAAYCQALDAIAPIAASRFGVPAGFSVGLDRGRTHLADGDPIIVRVTMPEFEAQLQVDYLQSDGTVVHMQPSAAYPGRAYPPRARASVGEPGPGVTTPPTVGEPYGTDMIMAIASARPLFAQRRPETEPVASYLKALSAAIAAAQWRRERVVASALVLDTAPKR